MTDQQWPTAEQFDPIEPPTDHPIHDEPDTTPLWKDQTPQDGIAIEKEDGPTETVHAEPPEGAA